MENLLWHTDFCGYSVLAPAGACSLWSGGFPDTTCSADRRRPRGQSDHSARWTGAFWTRSRTTRSFRTPSRLSGPTCTLTHTGSYLSRSLSRKQECVSLSLLECASAGPEDLIHCSGPGSGHDDHRRRTSVSFTRSSPPWTTQ